MVPYTASQQAAIDTLQSFVGRVQSRFTENQDHCAKYFEPITRAGLQVRDLLSPFMILDSESAQIIR
jgi:hypothetical protein